jgi:hypothetical protein
VYAARKELDKKKKNRTKKRGYHATHSITRGLAVYPDLSHCEYNSLRGVDEISVDGQSVGEQLFAGKAILVYDFHLFYYRGLAGFPGACERRGRSKYDGAMTED